MYDVIIAGAGPAGSTCARECASRGLKTLLLDKDAFPRKKPCGGAVSAHALSLLDFPVPDSIIGRECRGIRLVYGDRTCAVAKDRPFAFLVNRTEFDALLLDQAVAQGVLFRPAEQVRDVGNSGDAVEVATQTATYRSRFLIGADGVNSLVSRGLRPPLGRDEMSLALVSHVPCDDETIRTRLDTNLHLHFGIAPMGYGWLFPHRGYYSAGIAGVASEFGDPKAALRDFAQQLQITLPDMEGRFIPFGGMRRAVAKGRVLLAGDAAGFADPFHGEGIVHAILSGKLAAQAVTDALTNSGDPASANHRYTRDTDDLIVGNLRVALRMINGLEKYPGLFVRIFLDHPEALERYLDIPLGRIDYRQFQRWVVSRLPLLLMSGRKR